MILKKPLKDYFFVSIQLVLFVVYFLPVQILPDLLVPAWTRFTGLGILIIAVIFGILAVLMLNSSLSPYPTPLEKGKMTTDGVFSISRHPIYTSLLFAGMGYAVYDVSIYKAIVTFALLFLFIFKSNYEETLLIRKYPDYIHYKKRTRRFI